jgi:TatD DNase family protein
VANGSRLDAPWCSITSAHASKKFLDDLPASLNDVFFPPATKPERFIYGQPVKGRNEPCAIGGVAWVLHKLHDGLSMEELVEHAWKNTIDVFGLEELNDVV